METLGDKILPKICPKFYCKNCDYGTCKKVATTTTYCQQNIKNADSVTFWKQMITQFCQNSALLNLLAIFYQRVAFFFTKGSLRL